MDWFLQLPCAEEQEFWASPHAKRVLNRCDQFAVLYAILNNALIMRSVSMTGMTWLPMLSTVVYLVLALAQLLLMITAPTQHTKHRLQLALFNRVLRIAFLVVFSASSFVHPRIMANFAASINTHRKRNSPLVNLLRPIIGPPLVNAAHCNYVLPFVYVLPLQLISVVAAAATRARSLACVLSSYSAHSDLAQEVCQLLRKVLYCVSMAVVQFPSKTTDSPTGTAVSVGVCGDGLASIWQLLLFAYVTILFVLPCMAIYCVELSMKLRYLAAKGAVMNAPPVMESHMVCLVVASCAVVMAWFGGEALVDWLSPISCDGQGRLAFWR